MNGQQIFRFTCLVILWLALCYLVVTSQPFTLKVLFVIVASGIIVFVPLYKKYIKNGKNKKSGSK